MPCSPSDIQSKQLTIRYSTTDDGTRPLPDPTTYWLSPDLWLEGGIDAATAKVGVPNTVKARVWNYTGQPLSGINLEVWVCNYTLGISPSSSLASSNPGGGPMTGYAPGPVPPGGSQDVNCGTWTPVDADAALNGGHVCMAGNCYSDSGNGQTLPSTGFKFLCDCHHAQHNIAVVKVSQQMKRDFHFDIMAGNPDQIRDLEGVIAISKLPSRIALGPIERGVLTSGPHVNLAAGAKRMMLAEDPTVNVAVSRLPIADMAIARQGDPLTAATTKVALRPAEQVPMTLRLQFDPQDQPGATHTFDVTQKNANGEVIGGVRLVTVLTP